MLPKKNRADRKVVEQVFKQGKILSSPNLTFRYFPTSSKTRRISVVVPKTVSKKAVVRNFLRRQGYHALSKHIDLFPEGTLGVLLFKKKEENISTISDEIKSLSHKIN